MKCPHCLVEFHDEWKKYDLDQDINYKWYVEKTTCPSCKKFVILLVSYEPKEIRWVRHNSILIYPKNISRMPLDLSVDEKFAKDYRKSSQVLADSPESSAALSRRCLQNLLREKAGVKKGNLSDEIQQVLDSKQLPSYLADDLDAVRNIGNFATHPNKSKTTGEIVEVEPKEAEWTLNVLEGLFDFYFVQAEKAKKKREALNNKLADTGKPPIKK